MRYIIAKCVVCDHWKKIPAEEAPKGEMPLCEECFSPMIAERTVQK